MKKILQLGDPVLAKKADKVKDPLGKETQELIKEMMDIIKAHESQTAGLAAPQIGVLKRVMICRRVDKSGRDRNGEVEWLIMINPEIVSESDKRSTYWEGCLSVREGDLFGQVERPQRITVGYIDQDGKKQTVKAKGYFSHVIQHEYDHLEGTMFLSYVKDPTKLFTGKELDRIMDDDEEVV